MEQPTRAPPAKITPTIMDTAMTTHTAITGIHTGYVGHAHGNARIQSRPASNQAEQSRERNRCADNLRRLCGLHRVHEPFVFCYPDRQAARSGHGGQPLEVGQFAASKPISPADAGRAALREPTHIIQLNTNGSEIRKVALWSQRVGRNARRAPGCTGLPQVNLTI
jgi:hypothetical protein